MEDQEIYISEPGESICPQCLKVLPAGKVEREDGIYLVKECPEHGKFEALIWEGSLESYQAWGENDPSSGFSSCCPSSKERVSSGLRTL